MGDESDTETQGGDLEVAPAVVRDASREGRATVIDVRRAYEHEAGHIAGARHIEMNDLTAAADSIDQSLPVYFYCRSGQRSAMAAEAFSQAGFEAHTMTGGLQAWVAEGLPIEPEDGTVAESRPV